MAHYLAQFSYTNEAWEGLRRNPMDRSKIIGDLVAKHGGKLLGLWYCFGEWDGYVMFEAPDNVAAAGWVVEASSPGHLKAINTVVLLTPEELVTALKSAAGTTFPGPADVR